MSVPKPFRRLVPVALVGASAIFAGCAGNESTSTAPVSKPSLGYVVNPNLLQIVPISQVAPTSDERFVVCKSFTGGGAGYAYPSATIVIHTVDGANAANTSNYTVTLQDGTCADFGPAFGGAGASITATETAIAGYGTAWTSETFQKNVGIISTGAGNGLSTTTEAYGTRGTSKGVGSRIDFTNTLLPAALGDFVWNDLNSNGVQDAGEPGISGVTVTLTQGATTTTTTTNASGLYSFTNLLPGSYTVSVTAPAGYTASPAHVGGSSTDSDYPSATVTLAAGQTDNTIDFGFFLTPPPPSGTIGDFAWLDLNGNGKQDAGEPGLAGVTLTLKQGASTLGTQTTTGSGAYLFTSLSAGGYTVTASAPAGYVATIVGAAGTNSTNDSNGNPSSVALATNSSSDLTVDFGFVPAPRGGGQGCTPGYWKQEQHFDSWRVFSQTDMVDAIFGITFRSAQKQNPSGPVNLLQGLGLNGNAGGEALIRHGVAALLNSAFGSNVNYLYTTPQVIKMVHDAYVSGNATTMDATKDLLEKQNTTGCPLN